MLSRTDAGAGAGVGMGSETGAAMGSGSGSESGSDVWSAGRVAEATVAAAAGVGPMIGIDVYKMPSSHLAL